MSRATAMLKMLGVLSLGTGVVACSMVPAYERPQLPVETQLSKLASPEAEQGPATAADIGWRQFYRDPHLQELLELALVNNRDLRMAALNVAEVQAQYRIQRAALLPNLAASADATRQKVPQSVSQAGSDTIASQYSAGVGIAAWELDLFGRVNSLRQSALQQYLATAEARRSVQLSLAAQVGEAYFSWAANRTLLDLASDTLERHQATYERVKRRHERGLASSLDVSQAAGAIHSARADMAQFQRQLDRTFSALELLVGNALDPVDLGPGLTPAAQPTAQVPAGLNSEILLQRPDVRQAEHALQAANANIGAARAAFFPRLSLTASAGSASSELDGLFDSGTGTWVFSPQLVLPLFTWGANKAALDVAELRKESSVAQYERTIQVAFKEAKDAIQSLHTVQAQLDAQRDLLKVSERSLELATIRYEKGVDSFLEVLISQRNYNAAQQAVVNTQLAHLSNNIGLFRALGGGVNSLEAEFGNAVSEQIVRGHRH